MNTPRRAQLKLRDGVKATAAVGCFLLLATVPALAQGSAHSTGGGSSSHSGGGGSRSGSSGSHSSSSGSHSGSHAGSRTAHRGSPTAGQRQPGRSYRYGRGSFGHGYYGRGFYPYYRGHSYYPYSYDPYFYGGFGIGLLYGGYYPYPYTYDYPDTYDDDGGGYDRGYDRDRYDDSARDQKGGINLDVSPSDAQVYIDGRKLGVADEFDGWPDYLWLDAGTYDLAIYKQGYKTVSQQVTVYPGKVLDLDEKMESGASVAPENLATKTHERRDARIQYEQKRSDRVDRYGYDPEQPRPGDWRDRVPQRPDARRPPAPSADGDDPRGVRLDVEPADASVYLDGRFIGTGRDVDRRGSLHLAAGSHKLAVVRPGRKAKEMDFDVKDGQELDLSVKLETGAN